VTGLAPVRIDLDNRTSFSISSPCREGELLVALRLPSGAGDHHYHAGEGPLLRRPALLGHLPEHHLVDR
jgi:hypothetical protein